MNQLQRLAGHHRTWLLYWLFVLILFLSSGEAGTCLFGQPVIIHLLDTVVLLTAIGAVPVGAAIALFKERTKVLAASFLNLVVIIALICFAAAVPSQKLVNVMRGQPTLIGRYRGTQNAARVTLRKGGKFDIWWTGTFAYTEFFKGRYIRVGDSLDFAFDGWPPRDFNGKGKIHHYSDGAAGLEFFTRDNVEFPTFRILVDENNRAAN
jgi:hypothetical protein